MQFIQTTFRAKEVVDASHRQMKDEKGRQVVAVKAFKVAEKRLKESDAKLIKAKRGRKSAEAAVDNAQRQAKTQCKQLRLTEDELPAAREQIKLLKKKLKDAEKARDQVEQEGYDVWVTETEEALRAEVSRVCRAYCLQVWNEALNLAGVEASSTLRKAENVYYPPAIQVSGSLASPDDVAPNVASLIEETLSKDPLHSNSPQEVAEQAGPADKGKEVFKEVTLEMTKPSNTPKDSSKEGVGSQNIELVLATLPIPAKEDPKGKSSGSSKTATSQPTKTPKDKLVIKMKP